MLLKTILFLSLFVSLSFTLILWENAFKNALDFYQNEQRPEKIYLHTNSKQYVAGETIYLKGYAVEGVTHQTTQISSTVYIELCDEKSAPIVSQMFAIDSGTFVGNIEIPKNIATNTYTLCAYTAWQLNTEKSYIFGKSINIINLDNPKQVASPRNIDSLYVSFFPEGGNFITNIENHVAFKVNNQFGEAIEAKLSLRNQDNKSITNLQTVHEGIGTFDLAPLDNEKYHIDIDSIKVQNIFISPKSYAVVNANYLLPVSASAGLAVKINNLNSKDVIMQLTNSKNLQNQNIYVVAHCQGELLITTTINLKEQSNLLKISKSQLRTGIVQFTFFDEQNIPLAERIVFIDKNDHLKLTINPNKKQYHHREKITINFKAQNHENLAAIGNFSVSINKIDTVLEYKNHIFSELLLNNELRGEIKNPAYYFENKNIKTQYHLDLLMLTQGWRRFSWKNLLNHTPNAIAYAPEQGIVEQGVILNDKKQAIPFAKTSFIALLPDGKQEIFEVTANEKGEFMFAHDFPPQTELLISEKNDKQNFQIVWNNKTNKYAPKLVSDVSMQHNFIVSSPFIKQNQFISTINQQYKVGFEDKILDEVVIMGKKEEKTPTSTNVQLFGQPEQRIILQPNDIVGLVNIADYLPGRVAGLQIVGGQMIMRGTTSILGKSEIQVVVDGMAITGSAREALNTINPNDIASIEIYKGGSSAMFGVRGANGVIAITTKRGEVNSVTGKAIEKYLVKSYSLVKEYYTPNYAEKLPQHIKPDHRNTIFWKPILKTNANGETVFEFYNSDDTGNYQIIVEGMTKDGKIGRCVHEIESK